MTVQKIYGPAQTKKFIKANEDKLAKALAASKVGDGDGIERCPTCWEALQKGKCVSKTCESKLDPDDPKNDPNYAIRLAKAKAVMQVFDHIREWHSDPNESSTGTSYRQLMQSDGKLSCNCPGWLNYSGGTAKRLHRRCKHQDVIVNDLRLEGKKFEVRSGVNDAWLYVSGVGQ
jgi:hypothetical protein